MGYRSKQELADVEFRGEPATHPYQLVVFDWDGTLIDSAATIVDCMHAASRQLGLPVLTDEAIRNIIGLGLNEAVQALYPGITDSQVEALRDAYSEYFMRTHLTDGDTFPGVVETLNRLHSDGMLLAVATGKSRRGLQRAFGAINWKHYFHASRCADETSSKPHPQMLLELLEELGVAAQNALMVGDTEYDMEMAYNAGMDAIAVDYGVHSASRLAAHRPKTIVSDIAEIYEWLVTTN